MEPPAFKFPVRPSQPLLPLSPERVNASRSKSSLSNMTSKSSTTTDPDTENPSPLSSPTRKANLFADYNPNRSPPKESVFGNGVPTSPSLPELHAFRSHARTNSDVQGLVKRFEHLDVRDRDAEINERKKKHEAELRRAQIAREEAESDVKRLREEVRRLKKEGDEGRDRERKVGKRLDVVMDEFTRFKETTGSQSSVYEKEVRKARKEAFKSSSAVVKLQEDLKSTRATLRVTQSNLDMEKRKVQHREQVTFDAQYQLVAVQEELDKLKAHFKIVEEEKEALKTSLKEEEVARIAAQGMIALPVSNQDDDDLLSSPHKRSPRKRPASPLSDDKENAGVVTKKMFETRHLQEELKWERTRRQKAEEMAEFLRMECRFRCCGCASGAHEMLRMTDTINETMEQIRLGMRTALARSSSPKPDTPTETVAVVDDVAGAEVESEDVEMEQPDEIQDDCAIEDEDEQVHQETPQAPHPTPVDLEMEQEQEEILDVPTTTKVPILPSSPQTPAQTQHATPYRQHTSVRTITTTTTIPMQFTPAKQPVHHLDPENTASAPNPLSPRERSGSAPTFDRAAALAAIAYRRGRAKSIANGHMTPRKQMIEGVSKERRDISAPALGQKKADGAAQVKTMSVGKGPMGSARRVV